MKSERYALWADKVREGSRRECGREGGNGRSGRMGGRKERDFALDDGAGKRHRSRREDNTMKSGQVDRRIWLAATWLAVLAGCAWGVEGEELPSPGESGPSVSAEQYYAECYGADGCLLPGPELKATLCRIVNTGTQTNSNGTELETILKTLDACPTNEAMVQCIYLQRGIVLYNKEHLWPESHGSGSTPAYSDLHDLRSSDITMNSTRSSLDFDICRNKNDAKEKEGCWYTKNAFEPPDSAKGDIARALLYMDVRYETDSTPVGDLELVETVGTSRYGNELGRLSTLLDWNELDPVDDFERRRNELIYEEYQGNRNPFVDHPEWARRVFASGPSGLGAPEVSVTGLDARQRYPWNGLVDIDYEVAFQRGYGDEKAWVAVSSLDVASEQTVPIRTLEGAGATGPVSAGKHRLTWDLGTDAPGLVSDSFSVRMEAGMSDAPYWVVDMGEGADTASWPVETWEGEPVGGWDLEHKTRKLVLRRIEAGSFEMGSPDEELGRQPDETLHAVTISRPYGLGVFQVTQGQWALAMGGDAPARYAGDARPVECVDYGKVRGPAAGAQWPMGNEVDGGSFLGVLREKTGVDFDLPTESQWEHACRAGTATALNSGKDLTGTEACDNLAELGRYAHNGGTDEETEGRHSEVGSYTPNVWGLYDMHGNVWEWCLDRYGETGADASASNPVGPVEGTARVVRGGAWDSDAQDCRSARRGSRAPEETADNIGFRVACPMVGAQAQRMEFVAIAPQTATGRVELAAIASSGGEVAFSVVSGPGMLDGNELRFSGAGEVVVRARQEGDADRWPVNAEQLVEVVRAKQMMAFSAVGSQETTDIITLSASAMGGGPVVFDVVSGPGQLDGNTLAFTEAGVVVVRATQAGDAIWAPVSATQSVRVVESGRLHAVTIADGIFHGTVTADVDRAVQGDTVTLTVTPETGWKLAGLVLDGQPLVGKTFTMPDHDVVVSGEFTKCVMSVYWPVETERDFELDASYLVVAHLPGVYTSALRNGIKASRIGVDEVGIGEDGAIRSDSDSIVWQIRPGKTDGTVTLYNEEAHAYAASSTAGEHYAQLLASDTSELTQWWLEFANLPEVAIHSLYYPDPWDSFSRNYEPLNDYFANYHNYCVRPRLFKKVQNGELEVRFDRDDGFSVNLGRFDCITVSSRNGTEPYSYIWTSDYPALNGLGPTLAIPATLPSGHYTVQVVATDADSRQAAKSIDFTMGAYRVQNFDAWGRHDFFVSLSPDWRVDSGKTILNAEVFGGVLISRYIEGRSNTKAIEIFNGTDTSIDLKATPYYLQQYDNGATSPSITIALTNGTIPAGKCYAVTRTFSATNYPPDAALLQFGSIGGIPSHILRTDDLTFNGDDVIVLLRGNPDGEMEVVDRVGRVSTTAPDAPWRRMTSDHTLVRNSIVSNGCSSTVTETFNLSEWTVLDCGDFGDLGSHVLTDPDAGSLPSGYSLLLDTNATLATPVLKGGIGDISFLARAQGDTTGSDLVLAIESASDEQSTSWSHEATITIPLSQTRFVRYELTATNCDHTVVRFRHLGDGSTNRICLDDISIGPAYSIKRSENFFAWTNELYKTTGVYTRGQWTLCGRITANGIVGPLAATLPVLSGYLRTPNFADGIGEISFALRRPTSNDAVQVTLETSDDDGANWIPLQTFDYPTNKKGTVTNIVAWMIIPSNGCVRIVCTGGTAPAIVDNIFVSRPISNRELNFESIPPSSIYSSNSYKGWMLADIAINNSTNAWSGFCGVLRNGTITSPWIDTIGCISFMYRMGVYSGDDKARLKVEVSSDNITWTTLSSALAGSDIWQPYSYWFEPSEDWHYVRLTQTTQNKRMFIDSIILNDFSPGPAISFDKANGFTVELGQADRITASANNGTEPYAFTWFSDTPALNGVEGPELEIPPTLAEGTYTAVVEVADKDGQKSGKTIHFTVIESPPTTETVTVQGGAKPPNPAVNEGVVSQTWLLGGE